MIWFGWQLAAKTAQQHVALASASPAPSISFPIVAGGVLVVLFSIERILRRAAGLPTARFGEDTSMED